MSDESENLTVIGVYRRSAVNHADCLRLVIDKIDRERGSEAAARVRAILNRMVKCEEDLARLLMGQS